MKTKRNTVTCKCPAYPFPHRQGGGKCDLPNTCDFMETLYCTDPEDCECDYVDDCSLMEWIRTLREVKNYSYDTLEEKFL